MKIEYTGDESGRRFIELIPESEEERRLIHDAMQATGTSYRAVDATLYVEDDIKREVHGVTTDPEGRVTTHNGREPKLLIGGFW